MTTPALDVRDVSKRFGDGGTAVLAVRGVSLAVEPGTVVLIMGPSGSGKTTLLSMMGALLKPTAGSIHLDGTEISALSERRLPDIRLRQFGFIFQDFNLLSALSVLENVVLVAELAGTKLEQAREKATTLLIDLGLGERLHFLPEKLSGGEKQRVAIARALINDPTLILADEPTANLDSKIGHEIMRLLRRIAVEQGRSVVIVSHDQRIRDIADRVLWLEDGAFRDMVTMATDPVCGMAVEREHAVSVEREGETFWFCSRGCRSEFVGALPAEGGAGVDWRERIARHLPIAVGPHRSSTQPREVTMIQEQRTATDPVCGMSVDVAHAVEAGLSAEHDGVTYYLCGKGCKLEFGDAPEKYLDPNFTPSM